MTVSNGNVNTPQFWESYFRETWEKNDGRTQTRLFAKYFLDTVKLPAGTKTVLDVGCGMGDAVPEFLARYPDLQMTGADVSSAALAKARESYGSVARFENWTFDAITGDYDVIYCSNTLEHFETNIEIARGLLRHCGRLYVLVPYLELRKGRRLSVEPGEQHVATFDKRAFDLLLRDGSARRIRHWVTHTLGAWGSERVTLKDRIRAWVRRQQQPVDARQIFFEIESAIRDRNAAQSGA